jgi:hypothetical protein
MVPDFFARGFLQGGNRSCALGPLRQRGSSLASRRFSLRGPGKIRIYFVAINFQRVETAETTGNSGK